ESGIVVIAPDQEQANALNDFSLTEKDPADLPVTKHTSVMMPQEVAVAPVQEVADLDTSEAPIIASDNLELEIKEVEEAAGEDAPKKVIENLPPYDPFLDLRDYKFPSLNLLENHGSEKIIQDPAELELHKNQIISTLKNYDISIQKISATVGPTVTLYEIVPAAGVRISRIKNLEDDIALSLAALGIRIIAPIPGKGTIGIEVPNIKKTVVSMKTLLSSEKFQHNQFALPIAIGKKIDNENFIVDLASMPHLLMAGATGQGKSVGVNALLVSLLYKKHPSQLKFVLVDPKKVELSLYRTIEQHFLAKLPGEEEAIITDTKKVINTLNALCIEMDNRYDLLKEAQCRNIREYNEKFVARKLNPQNGHQYLPFIVLVIDEFADLIMTAGKEVEMPIARLAQLARAVGIHLIIATQRPSVNIITGTIKANFPARIAFKVSSKVDSRTILDAGGAEQLIGKGDMLVSYNGEITRLQCAFVDTPEVEEVCRFISKQRGYPHAFMLPEYIDEKDQEGREFDLNDRDALFEDAARLIVQNQVGSTSLLQRRMKLGYNRAGRLMDQLEAAGIVGPNQGSKARDVLFKTEADLMAYLESAR
ncbi:MAG: DNA translocase FtsK, partial [Chitinophagaceae bacterium]